MKKLLRTLFGGPAARSSFNRPDAPSPLDIDSKAVNRQQLVMTTLSDVLRISGIPPDWINCQTLKVTSRRRGTGLYIHIVINHWDERLMRWTCAFQTELKTRMERLDPKAALWVHGISWQLDMADSCPYSSLPDKSFWQEDAEQAVSASASSAQVATAHFPAVVAATPEAGPESFVAAVNFQTIQPSSQSELADDLEKLFAIRDESMKGPGAAPSLPAGGFEQTQPLPLSR